MDPEKDDVKPAAKIQDAGGAQSVKETFWASFVRKAAITGRLAGKEAQRRKLQSVDLRKADQQIGRTAFEKDLVPEEFGETVSELKHLRGQMAEFRQPEKAASESIGDKARAAANATAKKAKIEAIKLKEANLLGELGAKIRTRSDQAEALSAEIEAANKAAERIRTIDAEIEILRGESWVKRPLLTLVVVGLLVALFFGVRGFRHRDKGRGMTSLSIAAETERYHRDQREAQAEAERSRQSQLDSVKQIMAMTEKSESDYREKQKREEEERKKGERDQADAEAKEKATVMEQADTRRRAAENKQKELQAEYEKNLRKPVAIEPSQIKPNERTAAKATLSSIPLGPLPKTQSEMESRLAISADGSRIIVVASQGSRVQAIVDGQPGPVCRNIRWGARERTGSEPKGSAAPPVSPDNQRVAYITELDGGNEAVVIDSVQSPAYERVLWLDFAGTGHHVAFAAHQKDRAGGTPHRDQGALSIIDNGQAGPAYDGISHVVFSADGQHLAYIGNISPYKGQLYGRPDFGRSEWVAVLDGQEQGKRYAWMDQPVLSRDAKHLAFLVGADSLGTQKAVIDGHETPAYGFTEQLTMSDDGSRIAFVARTKAQDQSTRRLIDNGKEGAEYGYIDHIVISKHGERLAYVAQNAESNLSEQIVVDNGKASVPYDQLSDLQVSADGSLLSFIAKSPKGSFVVVNGQEFGPYYRIDSKVVFSADNKHWGCLAEATDSVETRLILHDGEAHPLPKGARYGSFVLDFRPDNRLMATSKTGDDSMAFEVDAAVVDMKVPSQTVYTSDGKHVGKVFASDQGHSYEKQQVMLDDKPIGPLYLRVRGLQLSDDGKHVAFIGSYNGSSGTARTHVNFDGEEGPAYDEIGDLALSSDGKHFAYAAEQRTKGESLWFLVVDGFTGPTFQRILTPNDRQVRRTQFEPDGSLTFLAAARGQLGRYRYLADALNFLPTMGQMDNVSAGVHVLLKFGDDLQNYLVMGPDRKLYAVGKSGGKYGHGVLFSCNENGSGAQAVYDFYGGDDSGYPKSVVIGKDGNLYGFVDAGLFRYDLHTRQYAIVSYGQSPIGLTGVLPDGALIGQENWSGQWWMLYPTGGGMIDLEGGSQYRASRHIAAIGPDGAIYSTDEDSLFRQSSAYSPTTLLHKFSNSPEEGTNPAPQVTFDSSGALYGFTKAEGSGRHSMIYRINRDGTDFRVVLKQDRRLDLRSVIAGDDGMLYFFKSGDGWGRGEGFLRLPVEGGNPVQLLDASINATFCHDHALYGPSGGSIVRLQIPRDDMATLQRPQLAIINVSPGPLEHVEPVKFSGFSGQTVPREPDAKSTWLVAPPSAPVVTAPSVSKAGNRSTTKPATLSPPSLAGNAPAVSENAPDQSAMSAFATNMVSGMSSDNIDSLVSLYGERVDYQDKGAIGPEDIRNDFRQYFEKWPQTSWQLTGPVNMQPIEGSNYKLTFPISFDARNPSTGKRASGNARETMVVAQDGTGTWKIIYQRENVTHAEKLRAPGKGKPVKGERYLPSDRDNENAEEMIRRLRSLFPR